MLNLKDIKKLANAEEIKELTEELTDDSQEDRSKWHLTPLGKIASLVLAIGVSFFLIYSILPTSANEAAEKAAKSKVYTNDVQRVFTSTDAVDFTQLAYADYLNSLAQENPPAATTKTPYDKNTVLLRLERIRGKLDVSLYKRLHQNYIDYANGVNGVARDEILCSAYTFEAAKAYLKLGGRETAVVTVKRIKGNEVIGSLEVTVDLKRRKFTEIKCL